jgi:hypothetical protein
MSIVIRYIIINDKITCIEERANKLLYLYNCKSYYNLKWIIYAWTPLPIEIQKKIINIYNCTNLIYIEYFLKIITDEYIEIIKNTKKDIYEKTFIKFLYDLNYINKKLLLLFTIQTKSYSNMTGYVLKNKNFKITDEEHTKIEKYKKNNIDKKKFYTEISFGLVKCTIKFTYYIKELIKIENEWWLITTCYIDKIQEEQLETEKIIYWIFSIII